MKPDWKDAPEWANWLAMDMSGRWFWWEFKPEFSGSEWIYGGRYEIAVINDSARESLEARP